MVCSLKQIKITLYSVAGCIGLHRPTFFHTGRLPSPAVTAREPVQFSMSLVSWYAAALEDGTDGLSRNVGNNYQTTPRSIS